MDYQGKAITLSRYQGCRPKTYICTTHSGGHVEIVPIECGSEHVTFPPIPLEGPGLCGTVLTWQNDPNLIENVKDRCRSRIGELLKGERSDQNIARYKGVRENLARLQSLDGNEPAVQGQPTPYKDGRATMDRIFDQLFGGDYQVIGEIQDTIFVTPIQESYKAMIGAHPSYLGSLVFIEVPLEYDEHGESGEYIIVQQSPDSLYGVKTTCCQAGLEVVRIPFESGEHKIVIMDAYEDDNFIEEFIERLDDMDTEDFETIECDLAETVSRQLSRMLEEKLAARARITAPLDRLFQATDRLFNTLGCVSGRRSSANPTFDQAEDRVHRTGCGQPNARECCGCGSSI